MPQIPFATNSYRSRSLPLSSQRVTNLWAEAQPPDAKSAMTIFGVPGLVSWVAVGTGPIRGMWVLNNILYVVSGLFLYSVTYTAPAAPVITLLGGTIAGTNVVSMSDNGTQLIIVNGTQGYIYSPTTGFLLITDPSFNPSTIVTFFDDLFVLTWTGTNKFFISAELDGTTYDALDFASAEVQPGQVVTLVNQQENLLVFATHHIETWYDAGNVNFPFARYDGATIERGCIAPFSVVKQDNSVFFLGDDLIFYRLNGVVPVRISTHAIEYAWTQYVKQSDAFAFTYTWEGHKFITLTFPTANVTWEYDIATNLWHERQSFNAQNRSMGRWRANAFVNAFNMNLIGDQLSGQIAYMSDTTYTEFGLPIIGEMTTPIIHSDRHRVFMSRFELDVETGVGATTGQGSDPQVMLSWSDDGGRTFSHQQIWHSAGKIGAYRQRLRWLRMGQFRNRVLRVTISDPIPRNIIANNADLKVGSS